MRSLRWVVHNPYSPKLGGLSVAKVYWLIEKEPGAFDRVELESNADKIFFDPISETLLKETPRWNDNEVLAEVRFLPGVTDNWARSTAEALVLLSDRPFQPWQDFSIEVHSGWQVVFSGDRTKEQIEGVLYTSFANPLLHELKIYRDQKEAQTSLNAFAKDWTIADNHHKELQLFPLHKEFLQRINSERGLALSESEIETIIGFFSSSEQVQKRQMLGWDNKITEVELECLAQTWSEHCKHKIFAAEIDYTESSAAPQKIGPKKIKSLYKSYIQKATRELESCGYLVSVFKDNAGIVDFDANVNVCVKVETHNSPSALDPFGGAITGILGVNRDILGCGLGAKPIANMDVFCLSTQDLFPPADSSQRPLMLKDPGVLFRGVHAGVEEGGNQSGIPTLNGSFCFASNYAAKPLIFVGSVGVMPKTVQGVASERKQILPGDHIVVAGGRLGKDGVHGATFSSLELHDTVSSQVVQIGDSITQKRLLDFTLLARDQGLIRAITDNGAGGVSSSIGEMATLCGGAVMDLSLHPTKYPGLEYWEMLISESQERMSYAIAPENLNEFLSLAHKMGVEAFALGSFNDSGYFEVRYQQKVLAQLQLDFLHDGLPPMQLKAHFAGPRPPAEFYRAQKRRPLPSATAAGLGEVLKVTLASPNVASREPLVRYYDHEVQGATRVKPYSGQTQQGPGNAGVIDLGMHGGEIGNGLAVANGLCPFLSDYDTYLMAQKAVDEAVRNLVAAGASPSHLALVDNFCWPDPLEKSSNPDAQHKLAQLVRACEGLYEAARVYKAPLVSGKDSMKNDFIGKTRDGNTLKISVLPTLLMTAIGRVPNADKVLTSSFQSAGDGIYLLGTPTESLCGSVWSQEFEVSSLAPEYPELSENLKLYELIYDSIQKDYLKSCHDISEGGLMSALAECCFGNSLGASLDLSGLTWNQLGSEMGSLFVVSVPPSEAEIFESHFGEWAQKLGTVTSDQTVSWIFAGSSHQEELSDLHKIWSQGVFNVYEA